MVDDIKDFDLSHMKNCPSILIIGKTGTGKSILCNDILRSDNFIDIVNGVLISPTEEMNPCYDKIPHLKYNTFDKYDKSIIETLLHYQKEKRTMVKNGIKVNPKTQLVLDDVSGIFKDEMFKEVIFNSRSHQIPLVVSIQYPITISPDIRTNFDYIFLMKENYTANRNRLYKQYCGMFPNFSTFNNVFSDLTQNYSCMVINNRVKQTSNYTDRVFRYKPTVHHSFEYNYDALFPTEDLDSDLDYEYVDTSDENYVFTVEI